MIRSPLIWLSALWIGALIHVDWHLGRPGPDHLSFGMPYHWLLALLTFAPLPWLLPFTNPVRWRVFGEFIAAGIVTDLASVALASKRTGDAVS